jgi:hypothetical protein
MQGYISVCFCEVYLQGAYIHELSLLQLDDSLCGVFLQRVGDDAASRVFAILLYYEGSFERLSYVKDTPIVEKKSESKSEVEINGKVDTNSEVCDNLLDNLLLGFGASVLPSCGLAASII